MAAFRSILPLIFLVISPKLMLEPTMLNALHSCIRMYSAFTMETMLASAFGRQVEIQRGEADELTKAAKYMFEQLKEGKLSRDAVVVITSECIFYYPCIQIYSYL